MSPSVWPRRNEVATVNGATRGKRKSSLRTGGFGWAMATPYVVLLLLFAIGPLFYGVYEAFQPSTGYVEGNAFAVALGHFQFLPAVINVATFMALYLPVMVVGVVGLALMVDIQPKHFGATVRLFYVLPGVITGSASVLVWYLMLQPQTSPFGPILNAMGFHTNADIFQDARLPAIFTVMAFGTGFGQWVVILYGSLQNISQDVLEAARIDGVSRVQLALYIKLPLILKYILYMLILAFASALQIFVEPSILSGLAGVGSSTWSINQLALGFIGNEGNFPSAAALSMMLLVVCVAIAAVVAVKGKIFQTEITE